MQYPLISEYVKAIQDAGDNLEQLAHLTPVLDDHGEPYRSSGAFAVVFKMAKEQNLSLNPTKISGVCGRLMCCLKHEEETYEELNRRLPNVGDHVTTDDGFKGEVQSVNVLRQLVKVIIDVDNEKEIREYKVEQLRFRRKHKHNKVDVADEELKALEKLEREEPKSKLEDN